MADYHMAWKVWQGECMARGKVWQIDFFQAFGKQVDILISKNQALQIIYLKQHLYETL